MAPPSRTWCGPSTLCNGLGVGEYHYGLEGQRIVVWQGRAAKSRPGVAAPVAQPFDDPFGRGVDHLVNPWEVIRGIYVSADQQDLIDAGDLALNGAEDNGQEIVSRSAGGGLTRMKVQITAYFTGDKLSAPG